MKKSILLITVLFAMASRSTAQNTAPYWSLVGNSNAAATSKLGTTNGIPLRLFTNNSERMRIDATGKVGIGITNPVAIFTVKSSGGTPVASWLNVGSTPVFAGFSENKNGELNIGTASVLPDNRAVFQGKRSRGTLAAPTAVLNDDYLLSFVASGYDGGAFQNPATISFYVDGTPTSGNVPGRISFVTGSNTGNRQERLKVGSTGNFDFNNGQMFIQQSSGNVGIGTTSPVTEEHLVHDFGSITHGLRINHVSGVTNSFWNLYTQSTGDLEFATQGGIKGIFRASDGVYSPSDIAMKKNFEPVQSILQKVMQLHVQKYNFTQENDQSPKHYGMMAQDVVKLFPEIVLHSKFDGDKDTWLMNYSVFGVLAIKAIQELAPIMEEQKTVNSAQKAEINALKERISKLEAVLAKFTPNSTDNTLTQASLLQNKPNPFNKTTIIKYSLPQGSKGQINIYDQEGKLVKFFNANAYGQSELHSHDLAAGTYTYTLMINGDIVSSKQMLVIK